MVVRESISFHKLRKRNLSVYTLQIFVLFLKQEKKKEVDTILPF